MARPLSAASSVRPGLARIAAALDGVGPEAIAKADAKAVGTVKRRFEPAAKRVIRERYSVLAGDLAGKFTVTQRGGENPADGVVLQLNASVRKLPLINFGGRWGGRMTPGATAAISKGEGRKVYHSAFVASIKDKPHMLVRQFSRDSNSPSGRDPRNKLRRLSGPSPYQMVRGTDDGNAQRLSREMNELRATEIVRLLRLTRQGKL